MKKVIPAIVCVFLAQFSFAQSADFWLTRGDQSIVLKQQPSNVKVGRTKDKTPTITVRDNKKFQTIDGFGYALTGGSASVINGLNIAKRTALLRELFGKGKNSISVSYLRVSIGASDLNDHPFTYSEPPASQKDNDLRHFSLGEDETNVVPLLKEIIRINPSIRIMASPWTAPIWMKTNNSYIGGSLRPEFYGVYARYFVKYIKTMRRHGITISTVTVQNEPQHGGNEPSMLMSAQEQAAFVRDYLGPEFTKAGLTTKIIIWDHNCNNPEYAIQVLNDAKAKRYIDGSAFHLYEGDVSAMSKVHEAHPNRNLYFTEQYTASDGKFNDDLNWHSKNVVIGSVRNWSKVVLEWNLASDENFAPHTPGGCTVCKGALTIAKDKITRNVSYYIIAHASKFVPPGSVRIDSNVTGEIQNAAFKTPDGRIVLIIQNGGPSTDLDVRLRNKTVRINIPASSVGTLIWK